jgi:hypothetical protein
MSTVMKLLKVSGAYTLSIVRLLGKQLDVLHSDWSWLTSLDSSQFLMLWLFLKGWNKSSHELVTGCHAGHCDDIPK